MPVWNGECDLISCNHGKWSEAHGVQLQSHTGRDALLHPHPPTLEEETRDDGWEWETAFASTGNCNYEISPGEPKAALGKSA